ncbi:MAG: type V CRISPR-associated protein Cas12b [Betaproteobacteria bacterium]|nr:type V CRISPR-associated protein Cas12b [Betaproteobacteria bacterium]
MGRAAAGVSADSSVRIRNVFEEDHWNGRLQAPRAQLDAIAKRVARYGWDMKAEQMRSRIRWLVSFSAKLRPDDGPWVRYAKIFPGDAPDKPFVSRRGEYAVKHQSNDSRQGRAKLVLARLPGLRVLSVDLGHRFAAACAVWETLTAEQVNMRCEEARHARPAERDLYLHLAGAGAGGRKRTIVYRRVGADYLEVVDKQTGELKKEPHPAPWARLDRQFLIKLPGEERPPRAASRNEIQQVADFAKRLGLAADDERGCGRAVDELMSRAVGVATRGLKRHARRAKIAYALDPSLKTIPGMGGNEKTFTPGDDAHVAFLTDALFDWHALATESKWDDKFAREQWNEHIAAVDNGWPVARDEGAEGPSRQQRRKNDDALRQRLGPIAEQLAKVDRAGMHKAWKERWEKDDGQEAVVSAVPKDQKGPAKTLVGSPATGLHADLRWLTDWIMGKYLAGAEGPGWKRNVGGLSVTRIATMKSLYQLHKSFAMRARPDKPCGAPEKGEPNTRVAQSILDAMERMREQRVKQSASRIVEAALGVGIERNRAWDDLKKKWRYPGRPRGLLCPAGTKGIVQGDPRFKTCHAVVIENLTNYRPDEVQTRRENRQLMAWSSSKVKKYLSDACQLHGLHLREVQAGYTSRQDSRTGAPGVRCADVPVHEFMTASWWRKQVNAAKRKKDEKTGGSARDHYLLRLDGECRNVPAETWRDRRPLRIPVSGGGLFVSASPCGCCKREDSKSAPALQADLNAAANIGLKALLDPDWPGAWWYVPCDSATYKPHAEKIKGSAAVDCSIPLVQATDAISPEASNSGGEKAVPKGSGKKERDIVNLWRAPTHLPINGHDSSWRGSKGYWSDVQRRVVEVIDGPRDLPDRAASVGRGIASTDVPW